MFLQVPCVPPPAVVIPPPDDPPLIVVGRLRRRVRGSIKVLQVPIRVQVILVAKTTVVRTAINAGIVKWLTR